MKKEIWYTFSQMHCPSTPQRRGLNHRVQRGEGSTLEHKPQTRQKPITEGQVLKKIKPQKLPPAETADCVRILPITLWLATTMLEMSNWQTTNRFIHHNVIMCGGRRLSKPATQNIRTNKTQLQALLHTHYEIQHSYKHYSTPTMRYNTATSTTPTIHDIRITHNYTLHPQ